MEATDDLVEIEARETIRKCEAKIRQVLGWTPIDKTVAEFGQYARYIEYLRDSGLDVNNLVTLWGVSCTSTIGHLVDREMRYIGLIQR